MRFLPFVPWVLVLVLALTVAWLWRERSDAKLMAARQTEASTLASSGQIVAGPVDVDVLRSEVDKLTGENDTLKTALAEAHRRAPGSTVTQVVCASTGAVTAETPAAAGTCILWDGNRAEIRVDEVELQTRAGNQLLVGTARALRLDPEPETELVAGKFEQDVTRFATALAPVSTPRWGVGAAGFVGSSGWAPGLALSLPPLTILGHELDANFAAGFGALGVVGMASVVARP